MLVKSKRKKVKSKAVRKKTIRLSLVVLACSRTVEKNISDDRMHLDVNGPVPVVPIMCSGRLSSAILLRAFENGADGVLVAGCNPDECRFGFGARHGVATVIQTQKLLNLLGIEKERLRFSGSRELGEAYSSFKKQVAKLGKLK